MHASEVQKEVRSNVTEEEEDMPVMQRKDGRLMRGRPVRMAGDTAVPELPSDAHLPTSYGVSFASSDQQHIHLRRHPSTYACQRELARQCILLVIYMLRRRSALATKCELGEIAA